MKKIKLLSRNRLITLLVVLCCGVVGAIFGLYTTSPVIADSGHIDANRLQRAEVAFVLPSMPPESPEKVDLATADSTAVRIWEIAVKQPLGPRKEPLTAPRWKIVGVSENGDDKYVYLLFDNSPIAQIKKVGDLLPGGASIVQISQGQLRISLNGQSMTLSLHKQ